MISGMAQGFLKFAVPTATAAAPAMMNSRASSADWIPPIPMTGMLTARQVCHTIRSATGFIAGPDSPPVLFATLNVLFFTSILMPVMVLISESASAPPASAAFAISVMSVTFGVSFMETGCAAFFFISFVMYSTMRGSCPKAIPPCSTLGQEMLTSSISISCTDSRSTAPR